MITRTDPVIFDKVLREVSETTFVSMLHRLSVPIEHRHYGNLYRVVVR